jgi:hypothetical protein
VSRRRLTAILLGLAVAAFGLSLAMAAPAAAAHRCHDRACPATPSAQPSTSDPQQVSSADPSTTPHAPTPVPTMGPASGVLSTPSGLHAVPQSTAVLPTPHPAGDLTVAILLIIAGLAVTAVVAFVLAFATT